MTIIKVIENKIYIDEKSFAIEKKLVKKLDRAIKGVTQKNPKEDAVLINEGKEGRGKTNSSCVEAFYIKIKTNREVHLFFKLKPMMEFASRTKNMIIIWDEPSLDSLSADQITNLNKDMQRFFMTIRKNRHIFLLNYTKFWKFPEYMVVDRANGLLHMQEKKIGRFIYIRKNKLEKLWRTYRSKHKRDYKKCMNFGGSMPNIMEKYFDVMDFYVNDIAHATYDDYDNEKDKAIAQIGDAKKSKREINNENKMKKLQRNVALIWKKFPGKITQFEIAQALGVDRTRLREWAKEELVVSQN